MPAQDADPQSLQVLGERLAVRLDRARQAPRVLLVVAGERLQDDRAVVHGARERPAVIERVRVGDDARAADEAERRHEPDDTAERRGATDRSAGIRAERDRHHARRDRGARSRRGAAREVREVPRIARGRPRQIERRARVRHLVRGELAEQHGARVVELRRRGGVFGGNPVDEDTRVRGREDALRVVDVLQPERNAVERATCAAGRDLRFRLPRLLPREVERARDERVRLPVVLLDALDQRLDQIHGRQLPRLDQIGELGDREVVEFGCHKAVSVPRARALRPRERRPWRGGRQAGQGRVVGGRRDARPA